MKEDFKWTDDDIKFAWETGKTHGNYGSTAQAFIEYMKNVYYKKQPKKDWEIIKETTDCTTNPYTKKIISVKRLSDGEVFTVGDDVEVTFDDGKCFFDTIDYFTYTSGVEIIDVYFKHQRRAFNFSKLNIKKKKVALFTTTDGVDIYEGDEYWRVISNWTPQKENAVEIGREQYKTQLIKRFSTKEAAEEYILLNKPILSVNDVTAEFGWNHNSLDYAEHGISKLKRLAKQKIQNNHE